MIVEEAKGEYLNYDNIDETKSYSIAHDPMTYIAYHKDGRKLLVQREGECNPKKCDAECCKSIHMYFGKQKESYSEGFGKRTKDGIQVNIKCKFLKRNKCLKWGKKSFPAACKQFPHIMDPMYGIVQKKCTFKFKVIEEIKEETKQ